VVHTGAGALSEIRAPAHKVGAADRTAGAADRKAEAAGDDDEADAQGVDAPGPIPHRRPRSPQRAPAAEASSET
jgi:hypothetical protein